jgi:hypothetical protein
VALFQRFENANEQRDFISKQIAAPTRCDPASLKFYTGEGPVEDRPFLDLSTDAVSPRFLPITWRAARTC